MNYALYQKRSNYQLPLRSRIGSDTELYRGTSGVILFLRLVQRISFYYSEKAIIFVRLLPLLSPYSGGLRGAFQKVIALLYLQSDKRKPIVGLFKLHRLLYFTRAVYSTPAIVITPGRKKISVVPSMQPPVFRQNRES